jgi:hypothetical protein
MKNLDFRDQPLYQKADEILQMVHRIVDLIPENDEMLKSTGSFMMDDALRIPAKIAGAMGADLYDLQMENAAIIRKSARDIYVSCNHFFVGNFKETEYLYLLRNTIEEFRILFAEWVKTFDQWNYIIDKWGLFNPPGVNYDDKDPDDDIPFDNPFNTDDPE